MFYKHLQGPAKLAAGIQKKRGAPKCPHSERRLFVASNADPFFYGRTGPAVEKISGKLAFKPACPFFNALGVLGRVGLVNGQPHELAVLADV